MEDVFSNKVCTYLVIKHRENDTSQAQILSDYWMEVELNIDLFMASKQLFTDAKGRGNQLLARH